MSNSIKAFIVVGIAALVAACGAAEEEEVMVDEPMVMEEPHMDKM